MIRLNAAFRVDLEWWHILESSWNGVSMMWRESLLTPWVEVWSDASGSWGCGAVWDSEWLQIKWSDWPSFITATIGAKQLIPITVAAAIRGQAWEGSTVMCHYNNQGVVAAVQGGYCKDPAMAQIVFFSGGEV